ncbi:carboxypeptidase-like regulatory domain-containing protein [Parvicella tangerina]|nr:carboxypeptidase-like regulatory domain-containing protein [Parvicella tangerina]
MKILIVVIIVLSCLATQAQIKIEGQVVDEKDHSQVIPDVKIFTSNFPENEVTTNESGQFKITVPAEGTDTIFFEHVGFESSYTVLSPTLKKRIIKKDQGVLLLTHELSFKELPTAVIYSKKVDTTYGSPKHSVEDFLMTEKGDLLLLAYEKTLKKGAKIVLASSNQEDITEATVPGDAHYLFKDYAGIPYVICEDKIFAIEIVKNKIRFESVSLNDFYDFYHRVIDTIEDNYYYSTFNELYPAVSFIVTNKNDSSHHELIEIEDDFMMELYRAQFKYVSGRDKLWAYRKEIETGIDKEVWIGATSFTQDILYKPVYAPLFIMRDTVHVFDQYKKKLFKFDRYHNKVDSLDLDFVQESNKEKWEQPLIHDQEQDKVYGLYNKGGYYYIKSINCQDGKVLKELKLANRFVERIKIFNGKVYYIYRPYESLQKKFIYSEELP